MIYLADETFLAALRQSWGVVSSSLTLWLDCFPEQPRDRAAAWWRQLVHPDGYRGAPGGAVSFSLPELNQKDVKHPAFITKLVNSPVSQAYLGDSGGDGGLVGVTPRVRISCIAWKRELAVAMGLFAMQAVYTHMSTICTETNADNVSLISASEVSPIRELMPELGGAYQFDVEYSVNGFVSLVEIGAGDDEALGFSINDISAEDAEGNIGQVRPWLKKE